MYREKTRPKYEMRSGSSTCGSEDGSHAFPLASLRRIERSTSAKTSVMMPRLSSAPHRKRPVALTKSARLGGSPGFWNRPATTSTSTMAARTASITFTAVTYVG